MICRVNEKPPSSASKAVVCHLYNQNSYQYRSASIIADKMGIPMHEDDRLLIGASHEENPDCNYIVADFALDKRGNLQPLEIRSEEWKNDNRILNVGVSKYLVASVTGTQRFVSATTLKQLIIDRWTNEPQKANPATFYQLLGVEVSHYTGNARRVPLKELIDK